MFRGREREHPDRGRDLLMRLADDVKEIGAIETQPLLEGRNMTMVLAPTKNAGVREKMPKQKTNSGAKKKFKVTATGKLLRRTAGQSHNLEHKSPKQKRAFSKDSARRGANDKAVRTMLGKKRGR